jgi:23S rRNA (adenine2503-C2)-methyltransferase
VPINLIGSSLSDLKYALTETDAAQYALKLAYWLYKKPGTPFREMDTLPMWLRLKLEENYAVNISEPVFNQVSADGTVKYAFHMAEDKLVETVYMPSGKRNTLCISSQAGCRFACSFCNTGKQGFRRNLTANEIINQVISLKLKHNLTHIVFMGMGEPFDNTQEVLKVYDILTAQWGLAFGASRVTVSTIGIIEGVKQYVLNTRGNLAISLHSPFLSQRQQLMPSERRNSIYESIQFLKDHPFKKPRRLSFEYLLMKGVNHSIEHAEAIGELLNGLNCHVNLLPYNAFDGTFEKLDAQETDLFRQHLNQFGIMATIRQARGADISAACGLLSGKRLN